MITYSTQLFEKRVKSTKISQHTDIKEASLPVSYLYTGDHCGRPYTLEIIVEDPIHWRSLWKTLYTGDHCGRPYTLEIIVEDPTTLCSGRRKLDQANQHIKDSYSAPAKHKNLAV